MRAVTISSFGGPDVLTFSNVADPVVANDGVGIQVEAAGINRADLLQREGNYPPPAGEVEWPGLECAGIITDVGTHVTNFRPGDRVMALLAGGGYAEKVAVPARQVMPVPDNLSLVEAAAIPEALATAWANLVMAGKLTAGDTVLIVGGSGGVGSLAIQLASNLGATVLTTAGGEERVARCRELGADHAFDHRSVNVVDAVKEATGGRGVDVILDVLGGGALNDNVRMLATGGRVVIIGTQQGRHGELDVFRLMSRRGSITGTTLRSRPTEEKGQIIAEASACTLPWYESGKMRPVVHETFPMENAADAHRAMDSGEVFGKVILTNTDN